MATAKTFGVAAISFIIGAVVVRFVLASPGVPPADTTPAAVGPMPSETVPLDPKASPPSAGIPGSETVVEAEMVDVPQPSKAVPVSQSEQPTMAPAEPEMVADSTVPAIQGESVVPPRGKPVAPVSVTWNLLPVSGAAYHWHGVVELTQVSGDAAVSCDITTVSGVQSAQVGSHQFGQLPQGSRVAFELVVDSSQATADGVVQLLITAKSNDTRSRVVVIPVPGPIKGTPEPQVKKIGPTSATPQTGVLNEEAIITGDDGRTIHMQPSK